MTSLNCLLFCLKLETMQSYYIILVNNVIDLLVCTLFGSELATEITLAELKRPFSFCSVAIPEETHYGQLSTEGLSPPRN